MTPTQPTGGVSTGAGGLLEDTARIQQDLRLVQRAINKRWPTHDRIKDALLTKTARIGIESNQPRVVFGALRGYMAAERMNQLDDLRGQPELVVHAHLDVGARKAVESLTIDELRLLRQIRQRMTGSIDIEPEAGGPK
jgi:hypothetical protein